MDANQAKPERLLRLHEVESRTGLKKTTIYAGMQSGTFPRCVRLASRTVAWPESRIDAFVARKVAEADSQDGARQAPLIGTGAAA